MRCASREPPARRRRASTRDAEGAAGLRVVCSGGLRLTLCGESDVLGAVHNTGDRRTHCEYCAMLRDVEYCSDEVVDRGQDGVRPRAAEAYILTGSGCGRLRS